MHVGVESTLDYLVELGVGAVWISPIYKSPMLDFGYDISNFKDIDPLFGNMTQFDSLVAAMKKRGRFNIRFEYLISIHIVLRIF